MAVPYTFGSATASIPLSQLDSNFATTITLGNTAIQLGNTVTTLNNMTLANATVSSGNVTVLNATVTNDASINGLTVGKGGGALSTNSAVGVSALNATNTGSLCTAFGYQALKLTTGKECTAVGANAGASMTSGEALTALGYNAANLNTGNSITALGHNALGSNTTGDQCTAVGSAALIANTTGSYNVAMGRQALVANTSASNNVGVGYQALYTNTTGAQLTAVGYKAGYANTASGNCYIGYNAGVACTGSENTFVGGTNNSGFGVGQATTTGTNNAVFGSAAFAKNTTGSSNLCLGYQAGYEITTGNNNICLGYNTGNFGAALTTGGQNVYIGVNAGPSSASVTYEMCIATLNSQGKGSTTGFINPNGGGVYQGNNSGSWSQVSDQRLKKNIVDNTDGLEKISQLRVRNFEYRLPEEITELDPSCAIPNKGVQLGVIAQEIQEVFPDCVKTESTGVISVDSDNLTWYMINAIKDLKALVDAQATTIAALQAKVGA